MDINVDEFAHMDFKIALETADLIENEWERLEALAYISAMQAKSGNITRAIRVAESMTDEHDCGGALRDVVVIQAEAGDIDGAQETLSLIEDETWAVEALTYIIKAKALFEDELESAEKMARGLQDDFYRTQALSFVAEAIYQKGLVVQAHTLAKEVLELNGPMGEIAFFMTAILNDLHGEAVEARQTSEESMYPTPKLIELERQFRASNFAGASRH